MDLEKFTREIMGDGVTTTFTLMHPLNTQELLIQVRDPEDNFAQVLVGNEAPEVDRVTLTFEDPPPLGKVYRVVVLG